MKVSAYGISTGGVRIAYSSTTSPCRIKGIRRSDGREMDFQAERSELRIAAVPEGYRRYSIRLDDDGIHDATVENYVVINHSCDILVKEDLGLEGRDAIDIQDLEF